MSVRTAIIAGLIAANIAGVPLTGQAATKWTEKQNKAHEIAEIAREIGLPESDPIIKRAQEIWWSEEEVRKAEAEKAKRVYLGSLWITGYDACVKCCGNTSGITASGVKATTDHTVAMCRDYPFGTKIYIEGLGYYTVEDRGVGQGCVDVFCNNHDECARVTGYRKVWLVK